MGTKSNRIRRAAAPRPTSVADALFTKGQQRVLGVLFGNPGRSYYTGEIITLTGSGTGAVQRVLARLESSALVTTKRIGNQKHFQANEAAQVFTQLHKIVLRTFDLGDILRNAAAASDLDARSPAERVDMMWQLTRDSWAFSSESERAESRLQRHAVSVRRRAR